MDLVILAGGLGVRLRPYTNVLPKPLMPLGEKPILERLLLQFKDCGIRKVYLSVGYLSALIMAYFGHGEKWGIDIHYVHEEKRLGTAGPLSLLPPMEDPFLVVNGDLVTDLDFDDIYRYHMHHSPTLTIGVHELEYKLPLGYLEINGGDEVTDYIEKPVKKYDMSMGIYVCDTAVLSYVAKNETLDFPDLTKRLLADNRKVIGYHNNSYWFDIGRPDDYERAVEFFTGK